MCVSAFLALLSVIGTLVVTTWIGNIVEPLFTKPLGRKENGTVNE